jgi:hypothetical protein
LIAFDRTRIAVRERGFLDLLDLSLKVLREHLFPLATAWAVGVTPFLALNYWLLSGYGTWPTTPDEFESETIGDIVGYLFFLSLLMAWQAPVAGSWMTLYLGQAMFKGRPDVGRLAADWLRSLPQLLVLQGLVRGLCMVSCVLCWLPTAVFPFLNEVVLLERNRLFRTAKVNMTTFRRSSALHSQRQGDLFGRSTLSLLIGVPLVAGTWATVSFLAGCIYPKTVVWRIVELDAAVAGWLVLGYFTVVRFLNYLDLRIRTEGWEVELHMRAEADRITRRVA